MGCALSLPLGQLPVYLLLLILGLIESIASGDEISKWEASKGPNSSPKANKVSSSVLPSAPSKTPLKSCDKDDGELILRKGSNGVFYGCSNYPKCTRSLSLEDADMWQKAPVDITPPNLRDLQTNKTCRFN